MDYVPVPDSMNRARRLLLYWLPVFGYAAFILFLSSQPNPPGAGQVPDKPVHAVEYAVLAGLVGRATFQKQSPITLKKAVFIGLICAVFAAIDEYYQSYIPGRDSSLFDWLADLTGIGIVITLLLLIRIKKQASG